MKESNNIIAIIHGNRFQKLRREQEHTGDKPDKADSARYESSTVQALYFWTNRYYATRFPKHFCI